jgi:Kef-type K+ transport system membrane component KefB
MNILLSLSLAMLIGLLMTRIIKIFGLPNVTAYIIAGLLAGPFCFKLIPADLLHGFEIITTVALGFIAFSIGGEFKLNHMKSIGRSILVITLMQAVITTALVDTVLLVFGFDIPIAITLGAIAAATAPAATLMVVRQYKAKGPVTDTLLPVVAGDDAIGLVIFSLSLSIARSLSMKESLTFRNAVFNPIWEIVLSLVIGAVIGFLLSLSMKLFKSRANRICLIIASVFGCVALSQLLNLSSLLACMMIGAIYANICHDIEPVMETYDRWTPPLFLLFFVISGAELDISLIISVGVIGIIYLVTRSLGKYFGAMIGAHIVSADRNIKKYLGLTLLPQAGVAVGMAQIAITALPAYGASIRTIVLCATLIYELAGPIITKAALVKAGEINIIKPNRVKKI